MAEFAIRIARGELAPLCHDGDLLCAFSDLRILSVHAQHICKGINGPVPRAIRDLWRDSTTVGRRTVVTPQIVGDVWTVIESKTDFDRADYRKWPATPAELRSFLFLDVEDFTEPERHEFEAPLMRDTPESYNPDHQIIVRARKHWIDWREMADFSGADREKILDASTRIDWRHIQRDRRALVKVAIDDGSPITTYHADGSAEMTFFVEH